MKREKPSAESHDRKGVGKWRLGGASPETDSQQVPLPRGVAQSGARPIAARFYPDAISLESGCFRKCNINRV
ncbi:hypothetical protein JTE90_007017 [Oedothorax gibbosus]|uniref:Uncharacterized protein n=1 Tax=Oedothorax gibbosus TaxID=931172 RepID=A0AAV6TES8_9ARAC|nr:hypothetical protein JTE90_007017 [Oedothorax gibbosus]